MCITFQAHGQVAVAAEDTDPETSVTLAADQTLLVCTVHSLDGVDATYPTGITFNGDALTLVVGHAAYSGGVDLVAASIWILPNPDDTAAAILPSYSGANTNDDYYAWILTGVDLVSPDANFDGNNASAAMSTSFIVADVIEVVDGFAAFCGGFRQSAGTDVTWTGATEDFDLELLAGNDLSSYGASKLTTTTDALSPSVTKDSATVATKAGVGAVIAPATACSGTPVITSVDADNAFDAADTSATIVGTDFCADQGTGGVTLGGVAATVTTWSDTSLDIDFSGLVGFGVTSGLEYGSLNVIVTSDATTSDTQAVTVSAQAGVAFANLTTVIADPITDNCEVQRPYGSPNDVEDNDQLAIGNVMGTGVDETDVTINADGSISTAEAVESYQWDFSNSAVYTGAEATIEVNGLPPTYTTGDPLLDFTLAKDEPMATIALGDYFNAGDVAIASYAYQQLSAPTAESTANGAGTDSFELIVTDASGYAAGGWVEIETGPTYRRIKCVDPFDSALRLFQGATWANLDDVDTLTVGAATTTGIGVTGTNFLGTPTVVETDALVFWRSTDGTLTADSTPDRTVEIIDVDDYVGTDADTSESTVEALGFQTLRTTVCSASATGLIATQELVATDFSTTFDWDVDRHCGIAGKPRIGINIGL